MPPKNDPYATPRARAADLILILFAVLAILIAIWTAPPSNATSNNARAQHASTVTEIRR